MTACHIGYCAANGTLLRYLQRKFKILFNFTCLDASAVFQKSFYYKMSEKFFNILSYITWETILTFYQLKWDLWIDFSKTICLVFCFKSGFLGRRASQYYCFFWTASQIFFSCSGFSTCSSCSIFFFSFFLIGFCKILLETYKRKIHAFQLFSDLLRSFKLWTTMVFFYN